MVVGFKVVEGKKPYPIKRRKSGFKTKAAALAYCPILKGIKPKSNIALNKVYEEWSDRYCNRVTDATMAGYRAAYQHFKDLHFLPIASITAQDLQDCMDACKKGKRTHQMMKVTAGLLWAYAFDSDYVEKDVTKNLYTGKGKVNQREPLTDEEVEKIRQAIGTEPYAEYVYALCYLGFRPGEFLRLKKEDLHSESGVLYLVGGSKTEAGRGRRVPVPAAITEIIQKRMEAPGDYLFPRGDKEMSDSYFRESVFKPMMKRLGIVGKVPYGARHTYSDKLKDAAGDDKAKAAIFGHTDYDFTRKKYQTTTIQDIKVVVDSIK